MVGLTVRSFLLLLGFWHSPRLAPDVNSEFFVGFLDLMFVHSLKLYFLFSPRELDRRFRCVLFMVLLLM